MSKLNEPVTTHCALTGLAAIEHAAHHGLPLNKYADPTEDAREGLMVDEAKEIAREDASLIWIDIEAQS